jgi:hypothetical protein
MFDLGNVRAAKCVFRGTQIRIVSFASCIIGPDQESLMRSKLAISALVAASLFGATAIASAQSDPAQPATGASGESRAATGSTKAHHKMKMSHTRTKPGVTTGMSSRSSTERSKAGGQANAPKPAGSY